MNEFHTLNIEKVVLKKNSRWTLYTVFSQPNELIQQQDGCSVETLVSHLDALTESKQVNKGQNYGKCDLDLTILNIFFAKW